MIFWLSALALTIAAVLIGFRPVLSMGAKSDAQRATDHEHDLAVYRHQLEELDAEEARGVISPAEASQARNEVSRRILAVQDRLDSTSGEANAQTPARSSVLVVALFALVFVPGLSFIVYSGLGSPSYETQPLAARLQAAEQQQTAQLEAEGNIRELVARAEDHLRDNPDDGTGWDLLAPIYFRLGDPGKAETAYRNALRLLGEAPHRLSGLGEVMVTRAGGMVTEDASAMFERALALDPRDARGRFFAGLAEVQLGAYEEARGHWTLLLENEQADPAWRTVAQQNLARLETVSPPPEAPAVEEAGSAMPGRAPALDRDTVAQMQQMNAEERGAVIENMVASLDERLRAEPDDLEGWKRLIRARFVLEQDDAVRDALMRARNVYENRPQELASIRDFASGLGLNVEEYWQ